MDQAKEMARQIFVFLATVVTTMAAVLVLEQVIRRHDVVQSLRTISLRAAVLQPLLLTAGYLFTLWFMRRTLPAPVLQKTVLHAFAALISVLVLGGVSIFAQGTPFGGIVVISFAVGVITALTAFGPRAWPKALAESPRA